MITEVETPSQPVPHSKNYRLFDWGGGDISFSAAWKGKGLTCHVAANKKGKRRLRRAVNEFCELMFKAYEPKCIFAITDINSVINLTKKCGFKPLAMTTELIGGKMTSITIMVRFPNE